MKILETKNGVVIADNIVDYAASIKRDYHFAHSMQGSIRTMFQDAAFNTYNNAKVKLNRDEIGILKDILDNQGIDL